MSLCSVFDGRWVAVERMVRKLDLKVPRADLQPYYRELPAPTRLSQRVTKLVPFELSNWL